MCKSNFAWFLEPSDSGPGGSRISTVGALFSYATATKYNISPNRMMSCFHDMVFMATGVHLPETLLRSSRTIDAAAREGDSYLKAALKSRMEAAAGIGACIATDDSPIPGLGETKAMLVYMRESTTPPTIICRTLAMAAVPSQKASQGADISYKRLEDLADSTNIGSAIADNANAAQAHNAVLLSLVDKASAAKLPEGDALAAAFRGVMNLGCGCHAHELVHKTMDTTMSGTQDGLGSTLLPQFLYSLRYYWDHTLNELTLLIRTYYLAQGGAWLRTLLKLPPLPNTTRWCKNHAAASAYLEKRAVPATEELLAHSTTQQLLADMRRRGCLDLLRVVGSLQYSAITILVYHVAYASSGKPGQYSGWMELLQQMMDPSKTMGAFVMHLAFALYLEAIEFFNSKPPPDVFGDLPVCCRLLEEATYVRISFAPNIKTTMTLATNLEAREWVHLCAKNYATLMMNTPATAPTPALGPILHTAPHTPPASPLAQPSSPDRALFEQHFKAVYDQKFEQTLRAGLDQIRKHYYLRPIKAIGREFAGLGDVVKGPLIATCILELIADNPPIQLSTEAEELRSNIDADLFTVMSGSEYTRLLRESMAKNKPECLRFFHATELSGAAVIADLNRLARYEFALGSGATFMNAPYAAYHAAFTLHFPGTYI
jgi:hypothetical protein